MTLAYARTALIALSLAGCSASSAPPAGNRGSGAGPGSGGSGSGGLNIGSGGSAAGSGINVGNCGADVKTTVSGYVYDPAGKTPLYNVLLYVPVPGEALPAIPEGVTCDQCSGTTARGIAVALSDSSGHFVLEDVPAGSNVPLVIQVGKWRREVTIPSVVDCQDNLLEDPQLTRLPANQAEGNLPKIAMVTGHSDALECLLRKIGISDSEFTTDAGAGRVNMYHGCASKDGLFGANQLADGTPTPHAASTLYGDPAKLDLYDMIILSCEGHSCDDEKKPYMETMKAYGDKGGRILFDHMHYRWFNTDNDWQSVAEFSGGDDFPPNSPFQIDTSFPKGGALAEWLVAVGASTTHGSLTIAAAQRSAQSAILPFSQQWVYTSGNVQYMTINTPVEAAESAPETQCGRLVHTDLHVSATSSSDQGTPFPGGCDTNDLSPEEKALAFMIFDLSACVQKEDVAPEPPPVVK